MTETDPLAVLAAYETVCNRYDVDAAVALFAANGCLVINGVEHRGLPTLRAAHEFDHGSQTQVAFRDCVVAGDTVACTFITTDVLDRAVGLDGRHMHVEFTIRAGHIERFESFSADEPERLRHRAAKQTFFAWARAHYPDEVAKGANMDFEGGASLARVVHAWLNRPEPGPA